MGFRFQKVHSDNNRLANDKAHSISFRIKMKEKQTNQMNLSFNECNAEMAFSSTFWRINQLHYSACNYRPKYNLRSLMMHMFIAAQATSTHIVIWFGRSRKLYSHSCSLSMVGFQYPLINIDNVNLMYLFGCVYALCRNAVIVNDWVRFKFISVQTTQFVCVSIVACNQSIQPSI